jgi:hypothetical protein
LVTLYQFAFPCASVAAGILAATFARQLRRRRDAAGPRAERIIVITRNERGGFDEEAAESA